MTTITKDIDDLRPHSAQALIPPIKGPDRARLKEDLATNGQQDPLHVTDDDVILDGVQRWTLLRENGATTVQVIVIDIPDGDQKGYVIARAINRRHLSPTERGRLIDSLLMDVVEVRGSKRIGRTATDIGRLTGANQSTVTRRRDQVMQTHKVADLPTHAVGDDGRLYPLTAPKKPKPVAPAPVVVEATPSDDEDAAPTINPELEATLNRERAQHILSIIDQLTEFTESTSDVDAALATGCFDAVAVALIARALVGLENFGNQVTRSLP